ncbi:hypothetical protein FE634_07610 [Nocardioides dongxiaopingii]|uniref:hypothetical protein n=1 Tax=Nocardioides TaxID=1839 RepID=UPI0010C76995|nr:MULTISPECIES: hypothetical protein [Nocardioides]QCW50305.1 hypothetical protein FE634_07610 [Nocardioides sp. S-1144]
MRRRWARRAGGVLAGVVAVLVATQVLGFEPHPLRVALLGAVLGAGAGLLLDAVPQTPFAWTTPAPAAAVTRDRDAVTQAHLRRLENHQSARTPDAAVRDRLREVADRVLRARHGVRVDSEAGRALLGPDLRAVLDGPVVRMKPRRIDEVLRMIEEL